MEILTTNGGIAATNAFVVADENAKVAVLFDAPDHTTGQLLDEVQRRGWNLIGLWLTHGHWDHIADHKVVTDRFTGAKVLIHPLDEPKLQEPQLMFQKFALEIPPRSADEHVADGQKLSIGAIEVKVIFTPGHSPGHVMYHIASDKILIGGDLIFGGSVGRTDFADSDHAQFEQSIRRVMELPDETQLLPGHGEPTTLGQERATNPFVEDILAETG